MKILIHSNVPWANTGYAQQVALLAPRLQQLGHDVAISAYWGLGGAALEWHGIRVYPGGLDQFGNDILPSHAAHHKADLVITLMDMWVLAPEMLRQLNVACWMPVDTDPLGRPDCTVLTETGNVMPIGMSRFGTQRLSGAGFRPYYVPHAVDTSIFTPTGDKDAAKQLLKMDGRFVIGINAANKDAFRKGFAEQFTAFARFHGKHPDTVLAVHSQATTPQGLNLQAMAAQLGILDAIMFAPQYEYQCGMISPQQMASWYQALDLYSGCAFGEGFGIPLVEAQACGIPVVTTDASAMTELCAAGWRVKGEPLWNPTHQAWWCKPSIDHIARIYEKAYRQRDTLGGKPAVQAREFALDYDADRVMAEHWKWVLDDIAERIA